MIESISISIGRPPQRSDVTSLHALDSIWVASKYIELVWKLKRLSAICIELDLSVKSIASSLHWTRWAVIATKKIRCSDRELQFGFHPLLLETLKEIDLFINYGCSKNRKLKQISVSPTFSSWLRSSLLHWLQCRCSDCIELVWTPHSSVASLQRTRLESRIICIELD